jgi:hypothetical protein
MAGAAGNITVVLSTNSTNFSAGLTEAQRQLDKFANASKAAGHGTVSSMQAASASIRLLDNPLGNNIRAIERLISQSAVLSNVLKAAFPLVGAIAIGSMIGKLGNDVVEFVTKINKMPAAIAKGFADLNLSQKTATDELILSTDRVQNELDKLNKQPQNTTKMAFDEARLAADRLAESIVSTNAKINELLSNNHITAWAVLMGKSGTAATEGAAKYWQKRSDNDAYDLANAAPGSQEETTAKNNLAATQAAHLKDLRTDLANRQDTVSQTGSADDANINSDKGQITAILNQQRQQAAELSAASTAAAKQKADDAKAQAEAAKAASTALLEARKKAAEQQLQQWESDNSDWKAAQDRSLLQDAAWWQSRLDTLTAKSANYLAVNKKVNADIIANNRQNSEAIAKYTTDYFNDFNSSNGLSSGANSQLNDSGNAAAEYITALRTSIDLNRENGDAIAEASLKMAVSTGNMTRLDAAQVQASIHTQQYTSLMQRLQDTKDAIARNVGLTDLQKQAQTAQIDNQMTAATGQRRVQMLDDNQATNPASSLGLVGFQDALSEFVQSTRDMAKTISQLTTSTLGSLNGQIIKSMTGQSTRGDWSNMGAGMFRNAAGAGLQKAEGSILGGLGFGAKADGSKTSPLYVRMADGVGDVAKSATSGLASLFHSSSNSAGSNGTGGIGSTLGKLFSTVVNVLPHFAAGGPISSNMLSVVGENGPELFNPSSSGTIIPNHQLTNIGTSDGGTTHNWNIDARGSTDPAQTMAMVQEGIRQATPHIVRASQSAVSEHSKRTTGSRR